MMGFPTAHMGYPKCKDIVRSDWGSIQGARSAALRLNSKVDELFGFSTWLRYRCRLIAVEFFDRFKVYQGWITFPDHFY